MLIKLNRGAEYRVDLKVDPSLGGGAVYRLQFTEPKVLNSSKL